MEALARRVELDVARDCDLAGDAVYQWVAGDPARVGEFRERLARAGIGGVGVGTDARAAGGNPLGVLGFREEGERGPQV